MIEHYLVWHSSLGKERLKVPYGLGLIIIAFDVVLFAKAQSIIKGLTSLSPLVLSPAVQSHHVDYIIVAGV
jgi:hypothetical protein